MGKFNSKVEQIESRTASWNELCSTFEGLLYTFMTSPRWILLRMKNVSDKSCKKIITRNLYSITFFSRKSCRIMR